MTGKKVWKGAEKVATSYENPFYLLYFNAWYHKKHDDAFLKKLPKESMYCNYKNYQENY